MWEGQIALLSLKTRDTVRKKSSAVIANPSRANPIQPSAKSVLVQSEELASLRNEVFLSEQTASKGTFNGVK